VKYKNLSPSPRKNSMPKRENMSSSLKNRLKRPSTPRRRISVIIKKIGKKLRKWVNKYKD
jgi:hypothetical protein